MPILTNPLHPDAPPRWRRPPMIRSAWLRRLLIGGSAAYLIAAALSIHIDVPRLLEGLRRGAQFLLGFAPPDFLSKGSLIGEGVLESVAIAVVSTALGVLLSIPVGFGAARNLAIRPIYFACRALVVVSRSFQELILAIVFVAILGFGPFAGILTLAFATIGFFGKLLAEEIEQVRPNVLAAMRSTGMSPLSVWWWGVWPQVRPRIIGLTLYRLDINFRESAIIGIVGAGGIGSVLQASIDRYEYDTSAAILLLIIAVVVAMEYGSSLIRRRMM